MRAWGGGRSNSLGKSIQSSLEVIVTSSRPPLPHTYTIMVHYSWTHQQFWCRNCGARGEGFEPDHLVTGPAGSGPANPISGWWQELRVCPQGWQPLQLSFLLHRLQQHCVGPQVHEHCLEDWSKRYGHHKCLNALLLLMHQLNLIWSAVISLASTLFNVVHRNECFNPILYFIKTTNNEFSLSLSLSLRGRENEWKKLLFL